MKDLYEIHVTVDAGNRGDFVQACSDAGVKPVLLHLQNTQEITVDDMMTSSKFLGTIEECWTEVHRIERILISYGLVIARVKLESTPRHSMALAVKTGKDMPTGCYFECHVPVHCQENEIQLVREVAKSAGAHVSRNIFKITDNGSQVIMVTLRNRESNIIMFDNLLSQLIEKFLWSDLGDEGKATLLRTPTKTEFIVYDDNEAHDNAWLGIK